MSPPVPPPLSSLASQESAVESTAAAAPVATTLAIVLHKPKKNATHTAHLTVWALVDGDTKELIWYPPFWDDTRQWHELHTLLHSLAPLAAVHVGTADAAVDKQILQHLMDALEDSLATLAATSDPNTKTEAAPESIPIKLHTTSLPSMDAAELQRQLEPLLRGAEETEQLASTRLQVAGQVHLAQTSQALSLLLHIADLQPRSLLLRQGTLASHLQLDPTAAAALHLWPPNGVGAAVHTGGTASTNSLLGLLSAHLQTSMGHATLQAWLGQPLTDLCALQHRQDAVTQLLQATVALDSLQQQALKGFKSTPVSSVAQQLSVYGNTSGNTIEQDGGSAAASASKLPSTTKSLQTLYELYLIASQKLPNLTESLQSLLETSSSNSNSNTATTPQQLSSLLHQLLSQLDQQQAELTRAVQLCEAVLDLEAAPRDYLVQASYRPELAQCKDELDRVDQAVSASHQAFQETWSSLAGSSAKSSNNSNSIRLDQGPDGDWQFRLVDTNDSKVLESHFGKSVQVHRILKNGVYFSTKELRQLSQQRLDLQAEYASLSAAVVQDAMAVASTYAAVLRRTATSIGTLDALASMAQVAATSDYCRPVLTDSNEDGAGILLQQARHPCVEKTQDTFIPNDVSLRLGPEGSFLLVTGPNMGGKSTFLRAIGAICCLAQVGSYVPCASAQINLLHGILARVGAGDLQDRGISTFMAEMLESSSLLQRAGRRSLVLVDELGRGTSTFDGYGLARAISEYLVDHVQCLTVFCTHFHELTALEQATEGAVQNCHVTAVKGQQGLTFLYQVQPGPCRESFGIQVAEMAHMPAAVIVDAKEKARELEQHHHHHSHSHHSNQAVGNSEYADDDDPQDWVERFRKLPADLWSRPYGSDDEKRRAVLQLLQAAV